MEKLGETTISFSSTSTGGDNARLYFKLFDANGNMFTSSNCNFPIGTYNDYYEGWYYDFSSFGDLSITFTMPTNVAFWNLGLGASTGVGYTVTFTNIQVEQGSTVTPYEPYIPSVKMLTDENAQQNTEAMDLKMLGWTVPKEFPVQNYVDGNGVFHQRVGRVELGTLDWSINTDYNYFLANVMSDLKFAGIPSTVKANMFCYKYITVVRNDNFTDKQICVDGSISKYIYLNIKDSTYTDATTFKTAMKGVYLYYELATPITKTIDGNEAVEELSSNLDGLGYGENGVKNLFEDEIKWMENITVTRGTKSVSDGKITLTATSADCYTDHNGDDWKNNGIKTIPCKPNTKYTFSWEYEGDSEGDIYICENGSTNNMSYTINKSHKLLITTSADAEYLTVRVGVRNSGTSITYWNFQLEEGDTATPYEPYIPSIKMLAEEVDNANDSLSAIGKCKNLLNPTLQTTEKYGVTITNNGDGTYTLNGTSTDSRSDIYLKTSLSLKKGTYKIIYGVNCWIQLNHSNGSISDRIFTLDSDTVVDVRLGFNKGMVFDNEIIKPMITTDLNATYDDFVPYTGDGETLASDVAEIKNDLGGLSFSASGTTLTITDGTNTWTLGANS